MQEIEVKIRIDDPKALRDRLLAMGAAPARPRHEEENILYDFPDGRLRASHRALRLRTAGKRTVLTFKGAKQKSRSFKVREEFETDVANGRETRKILAGLGLQPVFAYRKHRTILRKDKLLITVDETSVGNFLEIEGKRHEIVRFAKSLGYSRADFITASYVGLILAAEKGKEKV